MATHAASDTRASVKHPRFPDGLEPGDLVQIFSEYAQTWTNGRIAEILERGRVLVEYYTGDVYCRKRVPLRSAEIIKPYERSPDKWNCIGWRGRFDIEAETVAEKAEFIISFSTGNKRDNERRLWHLQREGAKSVLWGNELKTITFCTDRSLGTGAHFVGAECDTNYTGRANRKYDYLGPPGVRKPEEIGGFPGWFEIYRTAATQTQYGVLILNFTPEYLRSKACRWEFGYIPTEKLFVYIASRNIIVSLSALKDDAELIMSAFESADPDSISALDSEEAARAIAKEIDELAKIVGDEDDGNNTDAWCALPMYEILHTFAREQWGCEHIRTIHAKEFVAKAFMEIGKPDVSKLILLEQLEIKERLGLEQDEVAITLGNLGNAHGDLGDVEMQKQLLERALQLKERHYGREHYKLASTLNNLGNAYGDLGDVEMKKQLLERALQIQEQHYGREHYKLAITLNNLGNAYGDLGDVEMQKQLLERALQLEERHYGREHYKLASTLNNLGSAYGELGDVEMKKQLLERALQIDERHYGREHYELASTLNNLGSAYGELGDVEMKKQLLERALQLKEQHYGREHYELASTLNNLGNAHGALGDVEMKKQLLERALQLKERHYGREHYKLAITLHNLGCAHGALGDVEMQKQLLERALQIQEQHYGREHYQLAITLRNLEGAYGASGDVQKMKHVSERAARIENLHSGFER